MLHFVGQVFFFFGNNGSIRTHSRSVKLLEYGIYPTLGYSNWRSLLSITNSRKDTKWVLYTSESSRCENVIYPILREVYKSFVDRYTLWSHKSITYDTKLNGTPDYLFSTKSELGKTVLGFPIIVVVEAEKNDFSEGWGQCLAESLAVQKLNKAEEIPVYGIVTDGELWQFGKLVSDEFTKSKLRITITDLDKIFGTISFLLSSKREADLN